MSTDLRTLLVALCMFPLFGLWFGVLFLFDWLGARGWKRPRWILKPQPHELEQRDTTRAA